MRYVIFLYFLFPILSKAQSISYYPFNSILGLNTNEKKAIWLDAKFQTNSYFSSLGTDISPEFNIKRKPKAIFYIGAGAKLNYLNVAQDKSILEGYFMNAGTRLMPFDKLKKVQIAFEISPYVSKKADIGLLRSWLGIAYSFSK
jgi:hypothetical protein